MKHRHFKALTSLLLVVVMLASMLPVIPVTVNAADTTETIDFSSTGHRVSQDANSQVWKNGNVTFTNNKASSSTAVANYSKPVRLYAGSEIVVEVASGNITKIVFNANSGTYASDLKNSIGTVSNATVNVNSKVVTVTFTTSVESFTIAKLTKQIRLDSLVVTYEAASGGGETPNPEVPACTHENTISIGETKAATCTEPGSEAGVQCANTDCNKIITEIKTIPATGHTYVDGKCSCGATAVIYQLVTKVSDLKIGDKVIIVAAADTYNFALSTTQNSNNRGKQDITKNNDEIELVEGVQVLTLEKGTVDNTFAFNTGSGYLYAAGSGNNYLRTQNNIDGNASWSIEINDGVAAIKANGTNGNNILRYNNSNKIFSCYASGQQDVAIYKYVCPHANEDIDAAVAPTCTETGLTEGKHCTVCGAVTVAQQEVAATGHVKTTTTTVNATCTTAGSTTVTCECGYEVSKTVIPATDHNDTDNDNECDNEGCDALICEHVLGDFEITLNPTCTKDGIQKRTCSNCPYFETETIPATGHTIVEDQGTAPTCTTAGKTAGSHCSVCNEILVAQEDIPANGHTDGETVVENNVAPDCVTPGSYENVVYCEDCGDEISREEVTVPATGHTYVGLECTKCGDTITDHSGVYYIATIRKQDGNYFYMTSNLGTAGTKRYQAVDSGLAELPAMITETDDTCVFVLEINEDGTYCIRALGVTGNNYLGWTSGNSGILVAKDKALKLTLTENEDGTISLHSGSRYLSLNGTTGNDFFAFYEGTQKQKLSLIPAAAAPELKNYSVSLDGGVTINLEYNVSAAWLELNPNAYVEFASNFGTTRIPVKAGVKTYSLSLTPKAIDSVVSFTLSDGENVVESYENVGYSNYEGYIRENAATNEEFQAAIDLLDKVNNFTAAANGTLTGTLTDDYFKDAEDFKLEPATGEIFKGTYGDLGERIQVMFVINTALNYEGYKVTVTLGETTLLENGNFADYITRSGELKVVGLAPTQLDETLTVTVSDANGEFAAESSFVFNDYLKAIYEDADQATKNLIVATYQYGVAADAYNNR